MGVARPKYFFLEGFDRIDFFNIYHKTNSFPSGHTQAAFTLAILLMIYVKKYHWFYYFWLHVLWVYQEFLCQCIFQVIFFSVHIWFIRSNFLYKLYYKSKIKVYDNDKLVKFSRIYKTFILENFYMKKFSLFYYLFLIFF